MAESGIDHAVEAILEANARVEIVEQAVGVVFRNKAICRVFGVG
jgi:hypothetical protein